MFAKFDPFMWFLRWILSGFYKGGKLDKPEREFVDENMAKHYKVLWVNVVSSVLVFISLREVGNADLGVVITALLAPVVVLGGGWFVMSFGAIPAKLISISMTITSWMFTAFLVSLSTMFIAIGFVTPWTIWPVMVLIYVSTVISCIIYDTADGLKAGLDEAQLKHSRAALRYYARQGIQPEEEK